MEESRAERLANLEEAAANCADCEHKDGCDGPAEVAIALQRARGDMTENGSPLERSIRAQFHLRTGLEKLMMNLRDDEENKAFSEITYRRVSLGKRFDVSFSCFLTGPETDLTSMDFARALADILGIPLED